MIFTETLERLARGRNTHASVLVKSFIRFWKIKINLLPYRGNGEVLMIDGIILQRGSCVLIAIDGDGAPIAWHSCQRENSTNWSQLFELVKKQGITSPLLIVSDAQKGLIQAIKWTWPGIPHQRCMTHVVRLAQAWLTRNPKTLAGQELLILVRSLYAIKTKVQGKTFNEQFSNWL